MDKNNLSNDPLKVYLTSASIIEKGREEVYVAVRQALLDLGCQLTFDWFGDKSTKTTQELFAKTSMAINQANVVVAEVSFPSTGVGQQIALAMSRKIPVIALKGDWLNPSKFTPGAEGELMRYFEYNADNLRKILKDNLWTIGHERYTKFNVISTPELNAALEEESEKRGISRSQLLRQIIRQWLAKKK